MAILSNLGNYKNVGLFIIRVGLGVMYITHGFPKLAGGPDFWTKIGGAMGNIHITFYPVVWGLLAAITETFGGFLLVLGLLTRPVCIALAFMMLMATLNHFAKGDGLGGASHAIELGIVMLGLIFVGPGKYSVDKK